jgi:MFS family permease
VSSGTFRSLRNRNYRLWAGGALISNIGTWMQRTAQDWLVLAELTRNNGTAVGIVLALQYGPQLLLLPLTGYAADRFDRRKFVLFTQITMGLLALGLGALTVTGVAQLWHVYVFAGLLGCVSAFDVPARQAFVSDLVSETDLSNAVALNSTSFSAARMIGPAVAGLLISAVGSGWVFLINGASYIAVIVALLSLRPQEFHTKHKAAATGGLIDGFRYVWSRGDLMAVMWMFFLIGTFGLNFPIFISTMAVSVFHAGAGQFGLLTTALAAGSVIGTLLAAKREKPRFRIIMQGAILFGAGFVVAAFMPNYWLFGAVMVMLGISTQTFSNTANSFVQLTTDAAMRGRVIAILLAVALGGTPVGAPLVGWVADTLGPRWALSIGALSGFSAAAVGLRYLMKHRGLRLRFDGGRVSLHLDGTVDTGAA